MTKAPPPPDDDDAGTAKATAPRWLSGGRKDVPLDDNPTALAYAAFLRKLSSIFLKEQKDRSTKRDK